MRRRSIQKNGGRGRGSGAVGSVLDVQAGPPASQLLQLPVPAPQPLPCAGPWPASSFPTRAALPGVLVRPLSPSLRTAPGLLFCPLSATVQQTGPHAGQSSQPIPLPGRGTPVWGPVQVSCGLASGHLGLSFPGHTLEVGQRPTPPQQWGSELGQTRGQVGGVAVAQGLLSVCIHPCTERRRGLAGCQGNKVQQIVPPTGLRASVAMTSSAHQPCAVGGPGCAGGLQPPCLCWALVHGNGWSWVEGQSLSLWLLAGQPKIPYQSRERRGGER